MTLAEYLSEQARLDPIATEAAKIERSVVDVAKQLGFTLKIDELEIKPHGWHINIYVVEIRRQFTVSFVPPAFLVDEEWYANEIVRQLQEKLK
jgi:hypothetical protein